MNTIVDISNFVSNHQVQSSRLSKGAVLKVCWAPDRCCHFLYLGGGRYQVQESENSKLAVGDTFRCDTFIDGMPVYLYDLIHQGSEPLLYVIGKAGGLTEVSIVSNGEDPSAASEATVSDIRKYLLQRLNSHVIVPSQEGDDHSVVSLEESLTNALRFKLLCYDGQQLYFPADRPERECGYFVHCLRSYYTFSGWNEVDNIIVRLKHNGSVVKSLRQTRSFSPMSRCYQEKEMFHQIFQPSTPQNQTGQDTTTDK